MSLCAALNRTLDRGINLTDPSAFGEVGERDLNSYLMGDEAVPCPMVKERFECLQGNFQHFPIHSTCTV